MRSVVRVHIDGDDVTVDGVPLPARDHPPGVSPFEAAVRALSRTASRWRPVSAEIVEPFGVTTCTVLADGTTRDLRFRYTAGAEPVTVVPAARAAARPALAVRSAFPAFPGLSMPRPRPLGIVAVAGLATVVAVVALMVTRGPAEHDSRIVTGTPTADRSTQPPQRHRHGRTFAPLPELRIEVRGGATVVVVTGESRRLHLVLVGPERLDLRLLVPGSVTGLVPGHYTWRATSAGRLPASGAVTVTAPPPPTGSSSSSPTSPTASPTHQPAPPQQTFAPPVDPDRN